MYIIRNDHRQNNSNNRCIYCKKEIESFLENQNYHESCFKKIQQFNTPAYQKKTRMIYGLYEYKAIYHLIDKLLHFWLIISYVIVIISIIFLSLFSIFQYNTYQMYFLQSIANTNNFVIKLLFILIFILTCFPFSLITISIVVQLLKAHILIIINPIKSIIDKIFREFD